MMTRQPHVFSILFLVFAALGTGSAEAASFGARVDFTTGSGPAGFASADMNRDGKLDLVIGNLAADTVSILLGTGTGGFATAIDHATGDGPVAVAIADLDADGLLDVATANTNGNTVSVLPGHGDGTLGPKSDYATGSMPSAIAIADFDTDGIADLLTVNGSAGTVSVLLGSGSGGFATHLPYATGSFPQALAVADFNRDGSLDVASANYGTNTVSILLGTGTGSLGPKTDFTTGASPTAIAAGDLNADGILDLVTADFSTTGSVSVLLGNGTGGFALEAHHATPAAPSGIALEDVDMDGDLDVLAANYAGNSVSVFLGDGTGDLASRIDLAAGLVAFAIGTGDFDRDGRPDIASTNINGGSVSIRLNTTPLTPSGAFGTKTEFPLSQNQMMPRSLVLADFNRDGMLDAATANIVGDSISIVPGTGGGSFGASTQHSTGAGTDPYTLRAADLNRDGHLDLVFTNSADGFNSVGVMLANGAGGFGPGVTQYGTGSNPKGLVLTDLNHDGNVDIVTTNYTAHTVSVLLGTGLGTFGTKTDFATSPFPESVAIADLNNDGNLDLATANMGVNYYVSILRGNGDGTFDPRTDVHVSRPGASPYAIAIADLNRDGKQDVITANPSSQEVSVLLGDGTGTFGTSIEYVSGSDARSLAVADMNGDAISDLVTASYGGQMVKIVFGTGTGAFGAPTAHAIGSSLYDVAIGDVNADGRPDLVAADYSYSRLWVFPNVAPQTADLAVALTATPGTVTVGTSVTCTAVVTNNGPGNVTGVTLVDDLSGLTVVSAIDSRGMRCVGTSTLTCPIGPLSSGASVTVTIIATVASPGGSVHEASVSGIAVDTVAANDRATVVRTAFTDDPLVPGMTIKAAHLTELRTAIDIKRSLMALSPATYAIDATITPGSTRIKAAHLNEACTALKTAYPAAPCDPVVAGQPISPTAFTSLRTAVRALE